MKKALALLIFAVLLTGCAKQESAPAESALPPATQQTRQMHTAAPETETATVEPTTEPLLEIDELPFHNKAAYKVYEKQTTTSGKTFLTVKTYDEHDNVILREDFDETGEVYYSKETAYEYDEDGNVVKEYYGSDKYGVNKRTYDADGNVLTFVKTYEYRDGTVAYENSGEYKYDEQGRVVSLEERYASGEIVLTEYTYEMIESAE